MKIVIVISILTLWSCSLYTGISDEWYDFKNRKKIGTLKDQDYIDHLTGIGEDFIKSDRSSKVRLTRSTQQYLNSIYRKIVRSNEVILKTKVRPKIIVINKRQPFCFSLPGGYIFLSSRLIVDYLKHEEILVAAMAHEIIRTQLNIYKKKMIVPTGNIEVEKIISLTRININLKMKVNKWTYHAMKRSGYDGFGYLLWVQIQNKNALDFLFQLGDLHSISKEEYLFKSFVADEMKEENFQVDRKMHSSAGFYHLVRTVQKKFEKDANARSN